MSAHEGLLKYAVKFDEGNVFHFGLNRESEYGLLIIDNPVSRLKNPNPSFKDMTFEELLFEIVRERNPTGLKCVGIPVSADVMLNSSFILNNTPMEWRELAKRMAYELNIHLFLFAKGERYMFPHSVIEAALMNAIQDR